MVVGTRWWRRTDAEIAAEDVWGGPDEVTLAPAPRDSPHDDLDHLLADSDREQAERGAREQAQREQADRDAAERAEQEAREQAERERAERERVERAEREAREQAEREAAEEAERDARERAEQEARERAEQEARERAEQEARERAEQEARERAEQEAREQAEQEAAEKAAREKAEREAREQAEQQAREQAEREAAEKAAREKAEQEARDRAEREAREQAEQERVATLPGEAVSPSVAREAASRDEAARRATKADRRRRRRRVLVIFLIALLAVAAVWIVPRLVALALALVTALGGAIAPATPPETPVVAAAAAGASPAPAPGPRQELPRGGATIAPGHRVVVLRTVLGVPVEETADRVETTATSFGTADRAALPAIEVMAGDPGAAWQQLAVTRAHRQLLVLAAPTGPAGVFDALAPWERLLREPDVGLALDAAAPLPPEELTAVTGWLADLVRRGNLPQKLLVVPGPAPAPPAEIALAATGDAAPPVLRGAVVPIGGPPARAILAAQPAPDVVLYR